MRDNGKVNMVQKVWLAGLCVLWAGMVGAADANTFRYAAGSPILTLDPHASTDPVTMMVLMNDYEALVGRDQNLGLVPGLATKWDATGPTTWRFTLRQGVHFDEGQPVTADDAKFSIERAGGGMFNQFTNNIAGMVVVDDHTLEVHTRRPDPLIPRWLSAVTIMNRDWATAHDSIHASSISANQDQYAVRHTNGTGMFKIAAWDASSGKVTLERNDAWWGQSDSNATTAEFIPIASGPTRVAALLSGDVDLLRDVPTSDIARIKSDSALKLAQRPSFRQMMLLMSPATDKPADVWDANGNLLPANPWRDLRVRRAVAHAIDSNLIVSRIMQGFAVPTSIISAPGLDGYQADLDVPYGFDPDLSRKLLAEAGYPDGFRTQLQCTNDRYPNDEAVCRAVAAMLARVGIRAEPVPRPWKNYVQDLTNLRLNFMLIGQLANGQTTFDVMLSAYMTRRPPKGFLNWSQWSNNQFDDMVRALQGEFDPARRTELTSQALKIARDQVASVMLYTETVSWAMKASVDAAVRQDSYVMLQWVKAH